jgi:translation initiation factor IF-3
MDYGKEIYREQKQISKQKAKQKAPELKEIKLSLRIEEHDLETKVKRAKEFFAGRNKVRVFLKLMGREMMFKNKAEEIIEKFRNDSESEYEQPVKRMGNQFSAILIKRK